MTVINRHSPTVLQDFSVKAIQDKSVHTIAEAFAPIKRVSKITDKYFEYERGRFYTIQDTVRTDKAPAKRIDLSAITESSYLLEQNSLAYELGDRERSNEDPAIDPEFDAIEQLTQDLLLVRDQKAAKTFFTSSVYSTNLLTLSSNAYDLDTTTSTPIADSRTAKRSIMKQTGKLPNRVIIGYQGNDILKDHSDILDRIKWSERGIVTEDIMATLFGVQSWNVAEVIYNEMKEGITPSMTFMFEKAMLYAYNEPNPGRNNANLGTTFTGMFGDSIPQIKRFRDENKACDVIEMNMMYQMKVINSLTGYFIAAIHS